MIGLHRLVTRLGAGIILSSSVFTSACQARELPDFTELVQENSAAVVNISTTQKVQVARPGLPPGLEIPEDSPFGELFRHFFGEGGGGGGEDGGAEREARSLGSGFIVSKDGYIITNHHVVAQADQIVVLLSDRRELEAKVIGSDKRSDIALLKIEASDLPVVRTGNSDSLAVGEWVLAIGSPFGFDHSATAGIVSAKGRNLPSENYVPFIQTDVAINPGNSGGPLFNLKGEVVGVNAQIYSRTGGFMGLSFAIPIEVAMDVVDQLRTRGHVTRGWLGVLIQDVTRELSDSFGMDKPQGALVAKVIPDGPAAKAGIEAGDVIVRFNGREVVSSASLPPMVGATGVGGKVPLEILRNGKTRNLTLTIGELPDTAEAGEEAPPKKGGVPKAQINQRLGISVAELRPEQRREFEIEEGRGVLVTVVEDGPAAKAGLREGDVILMLGGRPVTHVASFEEIVRSLPANRPAPMLVQRRNGPVFMAVRPAE